MSVPRARAVQPVGKAWAAAGDQITGKGPAPFCSIIRKALATMDVSPGADGFMPDRSAQSARTSGGLTSRWPAGMTGIGDLSQAKLTSALDGLDKVGAITLLPTGEDVTRADAPDLRQGAEAAARLQQRLPWHALARLEIMRWYGGTRDCRHRDPLTACGDAAEVPYTRGVRP